MIWLAYISGGTVLASLVAFGIAVLHEPEFNTAQEFFTIATWIVTAVTLVVCGLITVIVLPSRSVGRTTCRNWAQSTGYRTRFVVLNWADTGTCLALAPNGRWVKNTQVIINVPSHG